MTTIVIKDLPENIELDRQAMIAITGGARRRQIFGERTSLRSIGILNYPIVSALKQTTNVYTQSVIGKPKK